MEQFNHKLSKEASAFDMYRNKIYPFLLVILFSLSFSEARSDKETFLEGKKAVQSKSWALYNSASKELKGSPLQSYLDYYYYDAQLDQLKPEMVLKFIDKHSDRAFIIPLKNKFFATQFKRQQYDFILNHESFLTTPYLRCFLYHTQVEKRPNQLALNRFIDDWENQPTLAPSCQRVEKYWFNQKRPLQKIRSKIIDLYAQNYITRGKQLASLLSKEDEIFYSQMANIIQNPPSVIQQKNYTLKGSPFYAIAIKRWAKNDSTEAQKGLDFLHAKKILAQNDFIELRNQLAVYQAGRADAIEPLKRIMAIPDAEKNDDVRQWGFRLTAQKDCKLGLSMLQGMSQKAQDETVWTFWKGRMYTCLNDSTKAAVEYQKIASEPSFYGFLAADQIKSDYTQLNTMIKEKMPAAGGIIKRGFVLGLLLPSVEETHYARTEWYNALKNSSKKEIHDASLYAYKNNQPNLGIISAVRAKEVGALSLRYPSVFLSTIKKYVKKDDPLINAYVILGLIRQESLFNITAKSHADAHGLMQLLIPTAQRMSTLLNESHRSSLYDANANIRYGIAYLNHLKVTVGDCLPYIFAGYNAGPARVKVWKTNEIDDFALWIENIPYYETRHYVKTLLENTIIYHHLNNDPVRISQYLNCQ